MNKITYIFIFYCLVYLLFVILEPFSSYDLGYHLATGKFILENKFIPQEDPFSFTHPTGIWPLHQWLPASIIYIFFHVFNNLGLLIVKLSLVSGICFFILKSFRIRKWGKSISFIGTLIILILMQNRILLRPFLFSFLFFAWLGWAILKYEMCSEKKYLYLIMFNFIIWCHFHAGVWFGMLFSFCYLIGTLIDTNDLLKVSKVGTATILGIAIGGLSVLCYNPGGFWGLLQPVLFFGNKFYRESVLEFLPLSLSNGGIFYFIFIINLILIIVRWPIARFAWILPWFCFSLLAFRIQRLSPYALLLCPNIWCWFSPPGSWSEQDRFRRGIIYAFYGLLLLMTPAIIPWNYKENLNIPGMARARVNPLSIKSVDPPVIALNGRVHPVSAYHFALQEDLSGLVFNEDSWGGWLAFLFYPQGRTFIDNRLPVFGTDFYERIYRPLLHGASYGPQYLALEDIEWVILRTEIGGDRLQGKLLNDASWRLVFVDDLAMIFVFQSNKYSELLKQWDLPHLKKYAANPNRKWEAKQDALLLRDFNKILMRKNSQVVRSLLGFFFMQKGLNENAREQFLGGLEMEPCSRRALQYLGALTTRENKMPLDMRVYKKGIRCHPRKAIFYQKLSDIYKKRKFKLHGQRIQKLKSRKVGKPTDEVI